jgi:hypothetical protein
MSLSRLDLRGCISGLNKFSVTAGLGIRLSLTAGMVAAWKIYDPSWPSNE